MAQYVGIIGLNRSSKVRVPSYTELDTPATTFAAAVADGVSSLAADEYFYTVTVLGAQGEGLPATEDSATVTQAPVDEVQTVTLTNVTGGTFTLTYDGDTTTALATTATGAQVKAALVALGGDLTASNISVSRAAGPPIVYTVTFDNSLDNVAELVVDGALLDGAGNERQTITLPAGVTSGDFTITGTAGTSAAVPFDANAATILAALKTAITDSAGITSVSKDNASPPWVYTFEYGGALAGTNVVEPTVNSTGLVGGVATVATVHQGGAGTAVVATVGGSGEQGQVINLTWDAVVGAEGYRVYKGIATGDYTEYFEVDSTTFTDDGTAGTAGDVPTTSSAVAALAPAYVGTQDVVIIDVDNAEVRKALGHHSAIGQYAVVALNATVGGTALPANS